MKRFISAAVLLLITTITYGQLKVIEIQGRVTDKSGHYLVVGSVIKNASQIKFGNYKDEVRVIDKNGKTFSFTPHQRGHIGAQAITDLDLDLERFDQAEIQLPSVPINTYIHQVPQDLQSDKSIIIQSINRYLFDSSAYKLNANSFFALKRNLSYHRLKTSTDTLIIRYEDFLDSAMITGNYALYFVLNGKQKELVSFKPYFDLTNQTGAMIAAIVKYYKKQKVRDSLFSYCLSQVNQAFGKPSSLSFLHDFNKFYTGNYDTTFVPKQHAVKHPIQRSGALKVPSKPSSPSGPVVSAQISLRQYAPVPGNQGNSGSCVAWASAYGSFSVTYNMQHPGPKRAFSPEFIYNQLEPDQVKCNGGLYGISIDSALQLMNAEGNLPKNDRLFDCSRQITNADLQAALPYKIQAGHPLVSFTTNALTQQDIEAIKFNISQLRKPVMIAIFLPARKVVNHDTLITSFDSLYYPPNTGIWQPSPSDYQELGNRGDTTLSSHELCVVGYNDNINGGSFEVLNSWGEDFGVGGYLWLNYEDFKKFGIDAYVIDGLMTDKIVATTIPIPNKTKPKQVTQNKPR